MNTELRLSWEPENRSPLVDIEERFRNYLRGKPSGASLLHNGTLLFTQEGRDDRADAQRAMQEAKFLIDFNVTPLKDGGYLVTFHETIGVFVSQEEFESERKEIAARLAELKFPGEELFGEGVSSFSPDENLLIGLYARGKLQRDAHNFNFVTRIRGA